MQIITKYELSADWSGTRKPRCDLLFSSESTRGAVRLYELTKKSTPTDYFAVAIILFSKKHLFEAGIFASAWKLLNHIRSVNIYT